MKVDLQTIMRPAKFIPCAYLLICSISSLANNNYQKWLTIVEDKAIDNSIKLKYCDSIVRYLDVTNPKLAIRYSRKLLQLSLALNDSSQIGKSYNFLGSLSRKNGNLDSALFFYTKALDVFKSSKNEFGIAAIYNNMATVYKTKSRYDLAIINYIEALQFFNNSMNYDARGNLLNNFAELYFKLGNYYKASELWEQASVDFGKAENKMFITHAVRGKANIFLIQNNLPLARANIEMALASDIKFNWSVQVIEDKILCMKICVLMKDKECFLKHAKNLELDLEKYGFNAQKAKFYEAQADFDMLNKKYSSAYETYSKAVSFLSEESYPEEILIVSKKKINALITMQNTAEATELIRFTEDLEIKVGELKKLRRTQELDAKYELQLKQTQIQHLSETNAAHEELIQKDRALSRIKNIQLLSLIVGLALVSGLVLFLFSINTRLKSVKNSLENSMAEKELLFKELNHRVRNNLQIVKSFLGIEMHNKASSTQEVLQICEDRIYSLGLVHDLLHQTNSYNEINLNIYLEGILTNLKKSLFKDSDELHYTSNATKLINSSKAALVGLILNELITNSVKYGRDGSGNLKASIDVTENDTAIRISLRDSGDGFKDSEQEITSNSLGIKLARGLAKQLGGQIEIRNTTNVTTSILSFNL
jgi:two-component system, sensor histidine kinase PdtaS